MAFFNFSGSETDKYKLQALEDNYAVITFQNDGTIISANC